MRGARKSGRVNMVDLLRLAFWLVAVGGLLWILAGLFGGVAGVLIALF